MNPTASNWQLPAILRCWVMWGLFLASLPVARSVPENVIVILADDLGAHDLRCTGSRFHETPNLDRLAKEGMRFTQAYSACSVCSPTRAALMTGRYPARLKITDWIPGHSFPYAKLRPPSDWAKQLPPDETTLAELAAAAGFTTMHVGKWHLGGTGFGPEQQGFSINIGGDDRGQPLRYFAPYGRPQIPGAPPGEYLTDREGEEAVRFITTHRDRPFFLNLSFYAVHTPLQAKTNLVEKYRRKANGMGGAQTNAVYAAMLESLDAAVGRVLRAVNDTGIADRTVIFFTSDNGGLVLGIDPPTANGPLRSGKGTAYEGGIRVPLLIKWPGVTHAGSESSEPVITMDVAATVAEILRGDRTNENAPPPAKSPSRGASGSASAMDGVSLLPLLRDPTATLGREYLCWHYPHYHPGGATPYAAIRAGDWKLIQFYEDGRHELFNLRSDPSEGVNLADRMPDKMMELARKMFAWQGLVGAQWPMYNPAYESGLVKQMTNGSVLLHARDAAIHGSNLRYEPMPFKNTLGWWSRVEDWTSWRCWIDRAGAFEVELLQGCGRDHGGSDVTLEIGEQKLEFVVEETGHFQNFVPRRLGRVTLGAGTNTLALKPQRKQGGALMDVRQLRLVPVRDGAADLPALQNVLATRRIVCVGDSITYAGEWVEFVEAWLRMRFPEATVEVLDLGLPSETVSGLSEPGHAGGAFPRPDLHERLDRLLERTKPDLIVACYGMNDGIYYPLGEERFQKFREGIRKLRERAAHQGVRVVHLAPPVFDPVPLAGRTLPAGRDAYESPFEGYDKVLDRYTEWLVSQRTNGWEVVDIHTPMNRFLAAQRAANPKFILAGDGVHANTQGHWLIAREVLRHLGAEEGILTADTPDALVRSHPHGGEILKLVQQRQRLLKDPWLTEVGHVRPGMNQGKPLAEAQREATELTEKLRALR